MTEILDPDTTAAIRLEQDIVVAGEAVAARLPTAEPLTLGAPQPPTQIVLSEWAAAAVAGLDHEPGAVVGILVRQDLSDALAAAPSGALDLGAALQPALDGAAVSLGTGAGPAETLVGEDLARSLGAAEAVLPLMQGSETAAVLFLLGASVGVSESAGVVPKIAAPTLGRRVPARGVELLHGVSMEVTVEIGRTRMSVRDLLALSPGDVLELDRAAGSPADLLVNGRLIARGEVVVVDEDFALRVTEIVAPTDLG